MTTAEAGSAKPLAPGPIADPVSVVGTLADTVWSQAIKRLGDPALAAAAVDLVWRRFARNAYFEGISNPQRWLTDAVNGEAQRLALGGHSREGSGGDDISSRAVAAAGEVLAEHQPTATFARITYDSFAPVPRGAFLPLRSSGDVRMLSFETDGSVVDLTVESDGDTASVMGVVAPPPADPSLELVRPGTRVVLEAERDGRFRMSSLEPGPLCIAFRNADGPAITDWVSI